MLGSNVAHLYVQVLLYWLTTTSVSTKYSYTQTFTVASIKCTPTGWGVSECGK